MKFYVIKPKSAKVDERIIAGVLNKDPSSIVVDKLEDADIAILQNGWLRSKCALEEFDQAKLEFHIPCRIETYWTED